MSKLGEERGGEQKPLLDKEEKVSKNQNLNRMKVSRAGGCQ